MFLPRPSSSWWGEYNWNIRILKQSHPVWNDEYVDSLGVIYNSSLLHTLHQTQLADSDSKKYDPKISFISFESLKEKVFDRRVGRTKNLMEFVENSLC